MASVRPHRMNTWVSACTCIAAIKDQKSSSVLSLIKGVVQEELPIFPQQLSAICTSKTPCSAHAQKFTQERARGLAEQRNLKTEANTSTDDNHTDKPVQRGGGLKKRGEEEAAVKSGGSMRKAKKRGRFTWTGGGEHGQGVRIMVPPAISLNKLLLTL